MRLSASLFAVALAGCAATPAQQERAAAMGVKAQDDLARELAGLTPGEPSTCLPEPVRQQLSSKAFGPTIVYAASSDMKYRNDTSGGCERAGLDVLVSQTPTGRVCRGDILRTVDRVSGFQTGACTLGDFVPYRRAR